MLRTYVDYRPWECWTLGSECDGGFAQFTKAPSRETFKVDCDWTDVELASLPCAYSTAEGMLHRANVVEGETVLITGASGGVGSAAVQLARRRGATVIAVAGGEKNDQVRALGADRVVRRGDSVVKTLGRETVDVVIDVAAGPAFADLLDVLKAGRTLRGRGCDCRTDRRARCPHALFEGPDFLWVHIPGGRRLRKPGLLCRTR